MRREFPEDVTGEGGRRGRDNPIHYGPKSSDMNVTRPSVFVTLALCAVLAPAWLGAQQPARADSGAIVARLVAEPASLTLRAG